MELVSKKNTIIALAAILVVAYGYMAIRLNANKPKVPNDNFKQDLETMQTQSKSTDVGSIKSDLDNTNFSNLDQELPSIDQELNSTQ